MKRSTWGIFRISLVSLLCCASIAEAHHSFVADFDNREIVELQGTVNRMVPINPHPRIWLDVMQSDGELITWELQGSRGATDDLQVGSVVSVRGYAHRRQDYSLYVDTVALNDNLVVDNNDLGAGQERDGVEIAQEIVSYAELAYPDRGTRWPRDISGDWNQRFRGLISIDDLTPNPIPFTDEGFAVYQTNQEFGKDPGLRCLNTGLARLFSGPSVMKIYEVGPKYIFLYSLGDRAHRTIHMDGTPPPDDLALSDFGYSTGYWDEDDRLIVETTHLKPMWLDVTGIESSGSDTRVIETYELDENGETMKRTMSFYDPYFSEPLTRVRYASRAEPRPLSDGKGCDPDPFYRDLQVEGTLSDYFNAKFDALAQ